MLDSSLDPISHIISGEDECENLANCTDDQEKPLWAFCSDEIRS
jgi:hypothetical protein